MGTTRLPWLLGVVACAAACAPQVSMSEHFNPSRASNTSPPPTLLTATVSCLESQQVASGGQRVRRATDFGQIMVQRIDRRLARIGDGTPPVPASLCQELTSPNAMSANDWSAPEMPPVLHELLEMSGAQSVLVPVVHSTMQCDRGAHPWAWGEPAYHDDEGQVDCHENEITLAAYIYDHQGKLIWKATHVYQLSEPPDTAGAAEALLRQAPIEAAVDLSRGGPS